MARLFCFILSLALVNGQISKFISKKNVVNVAKNSLKSTDSEASYYSMVSLNNLEEKNVCDCASTMKKMSFASNSHDAFYHSQIAKFCECGSMTFPDNLSFEKEIETSTDLHTLAWSIGSAYEAKRPLSQTAVGLAIGKLKMFMTTEGRFRSSLDESAQEATALNTVSVLECLISASHSEEFSSFSAELFEKAFALIPTETDNGFESSPLLITPLSKLSEKKLRLLGPRLALLAESLLDLASTSDIRIVGRAVEALRIVSTYKSAPLVVNLQQVNHVRVPAGALDLTVQVFDVFGVTVEGVTVEIVSIKNVAKDGSLLQAPHSGSTISIPYSTVTPGRHIALVNVAVEGRTKPLSAQSIFVITQPVTVDDVRAGVARDGEKEVAKSDFVQVGGSSRQLAKLRASASDSDVLFVEFAVLAEDQSEGSVRKPHQTVVRLAARQSGGPTVLFHAKKDDSLASPNKLVHSARIALAEQADKFAHKSGLFDISVLVADAAFSSPLTVDVGSVDIAFPVQQITNLPLYAKSLLYASDITLTALPEIEHVMRPPAKKASNFMAAVFTALTALPLLGFLLFAASLAPNMSSLFSLSGVSFSVCLAFTLGLYVCYWLALDGVSFYQTIKYLFCIFPLTVMIGRYALSVVSARRTVAADKQQN